MMNIETGKILISDPFLKDPNFIRTVIFITEYDVNGAVGFVLNKLFPRKLNDLVEFQNAPAFPLYYGGPVQTDTLHFLHQRPDLIDGGVHIIDNIYWGGNFKQVLKNIATKSINYNDIRMYIGYSGCQEKQLDEEINESSWIVHNANSKTVFFNNTTTLWQEVLKEMGGKYKLMINYPNDPQFN